ncbi:MAG TPA: glycosyltransferase [Bauldia sp.]|nr:glycosyltransferase [Bauldia sp.]
MTVDAPSTGSLDAAGPLPRVDVVIKTLNEEAHVARAIESALAAVARFDGEVVLVDSASTDRTVEIASRYPIRIIQLADARDRSCGIGPELGYRHSSGAYIYILDGDMELDAGFLDEAVARLEKDGRLAGVGGRIEDVHLQDIDSKVRVQRGMTQPAGETDRLNGGGLYRRAAIEDVGYLADRNLHSFEEFDLGARLRGKGWRLLKLDRTAVRHFGYTVDPYRLLFGRFRTGYAFGIGEVVRAGFSAGYAPSLLRLRGLAISVGVLIFWLFVALILLSGEPLAAAAVAIVAAVLAIVVMAVRRGSLEIGVYSVVAWHASALGLVIGILRHRTSPIAPIPVRLAQPPASRRVSADDRG